MADDWYRRKTWTTWDREEFFTRLRRSRAANRAQYVRIQAYELLTTGTRDGCLAALELLDLILSEWPADLQLASVFHHRAECFCVLGEPERAIEAYRRVFETQRVQKHWLTGAHLDFGWLVAVSPLPALYDESLALLEEFSHDAFPVQRYRRNAIQALICAARGEPEKARAFARAALEEAGRGHSGFLRHAALGLVESPDRRVHARLQGLAG